MFDTLNTEIAESASTPRRRSRLTDEQRRAAYIAIGSDLRLGSNRSYADNLRNASGLDGSSFPGFLRGTGLARTTKTIKHLHSQARGRRVFQYRVTPAFRKRFEQITGEAY